MPEEPLIVPPEPLPEPLPEPPMVPQIVNRAIQLSKPCVMTREKVFSSVTITRLEDFPGERLVLAMIEEYHNPIVLWQADEYTAIGNWTQEQAEQKLVNIIASINTF